MWKERHRERESTMQGGNTIGVIIIIAVFWLLGLLMAWSMCVVAARADRRMEEIRHTHTDTDISRPADTGHVD